MGHRREDETFRPSPTTMLRWHSYTEQGQPWDCWTWTGTLHQGYGSLTIGTVQHGNGRRAVPEKAHRIAYRQFVGPIADGLEIDHICRNPSCVNPYHLRAVTPRENALNSDLTNAARMRCHNGHPFTEGNTYRHTDSDGVERRVCRTCRREYMRRYRASKAG